jgi:hypothetical protein
MHRPLAQRRQFSPALTKRATVVDAMWI